MSIRVVSSCILLLVIIIYFNEWVCNSWASEASTTLGCSIEILRDIYIIVRLRYREFTSFRDLRFGALVVRAERGRYKRPEDP